MLVCLDVYSVAMFVKGKFLLKTETIRYQKRVNGKANP